MWPEVRPEVPVRSGVSGRAACELSPAWVKGRGRDSGSTQGQRSRVPLGVAEPVALALPWGAPRHVSPAVPPWLPGSPLRPASTRSSKSAFPCGQRGTSCHGRGHGRGRGSEVSSSPHLVADGQRQVVAGAEVAAQEERRAAAAQTASGHHGHAVSQQLCLIQVVGGEDQCATWATGNQATFTVGTRGLRASCGLCQELPALCIKLLSIPQNPIPSTSSSETSSVP